LVNPAFGGKEYNVDMAAAIIGRFGPHWPFMFPQENTLSVLNRGAVKGLTARHFTNTSETTHSWLFIFSHE